ncbi:MAG: heparinase II/III family protein [Silvanigrellaceae bacterium]|nr:heparinase II/III family protein [Silvanigrellaceae bacterium]
MRILHLSYPTSPSVKEFMQLNIWRSSKQRFFFESKDSLTFPKKKNEPLKLEAEAILKGEFKFFSSTVYLLGNKYDWITNPDTGFRYDKTKHWVDINDYSKEAGDIKYVWEKSRFTYLDTIIRYDYHFEIDQSEFVFSEIENWINNNPINSGPNYKCSQEITIRSFNWIFALFYYKNSLSLTPARFEKIIHFLYWQAKHVYSNINFSKIAVRNNHAIAECLGIYSFGILFPFFPESKKWIDHGKKWFENEIDYQIYPDGTFLQFSMNYHRVVVQLLTWAIQLNRLNDTPFNDFVYSRAQSTVDFLTSCMNEKNGMLPNYGANDGALFFNFCVQNFRDYRPQLESLKFSLELDICRSETEEKYWFGFDNSYFNNHQKKVEGKTRFAKLKKFESGGYYIIEDEDDTLTFVRCGNHKDRPSQADNLHLDIWVKGENILRDAGSYKYNTGDRDLRYFFGTESHNTVSLGKNDQMLKGGRFVWYNWTQSLGAELNENNDEYLFQGRISAFKHLGGEITHKRVIKKQKGSYHWEIIDEVVHKTGLPIIQYWHPSDSFFDNFEISAKTLNGDNIEFEIENCFYSSLYGEKVTSKQVVFKTNEHCIITSIREKIN